jgi:anti-sigma-K factor RskA
MDCSQRKDDILHYVAGALDDGSCAELREHLATGCPECAGVAAEAEALLAQLPLGLDEVRPSPNVKRRLMEKIRNAPMAGGPIPIRRDWEMAVLPASIAAVLAVAVTLLAVSQFTHRPRVPTGPDTRDMQITLLEKLLEQKNAETVELRHELLDATRPNLAGLKYAELTGSDQPQVLGRTFIDVQTGKWYFFSDGMKPPAAGRIYELWLINQNKPIPAGTFAIDSHGMGICCGPVPQLQPGSMVTLAVTDEPAPGVQAPTTSPLITGQIQLQ